VYHRFARKRHASKYPYLGTHARDIGRNRRHHVHRIRTCHTTPEGIRWRSFPLYVAMQQAQRRRPEISQLLFSPERYLERGSYRGCNTILIANLGPDHESNSFFISKRNFESLLNQRQRGVADVFETCALVISHRGDKADEYEPVRHSANLNLSAAAMASIILELTVDATMQSLSIPFCGRNGYVLALQSRGERSTNLAVCPMPCTAPVCFQRIEHLAGLR
jgi:hypothetical protein